MSHTYPGNQSREGAVDRGSFGQERLERVIATERESLIKAFSPCLAVSAVVQSSSLFSIQESHEKKASG